MSTENNNPLESSEFDPSNVFVNVWACDLDIPTEGTTPGDRSNVRLDQTLEQFDLEMETLWLRKEDKEWVPSEDVDFVGTLGRGGRSINIHSASRIVAVRPKQLCIGPKSLGTHEGAGKNKFIYENPPIHPILIFRRKNPNNLVRENDEVSDEITAVSKKVNGGDPNGAVGLLAA